MHKPQPKKEMTAYSLHFCSPRLLFEAVVVIPFSQTLHGVQDHEAEKPILPELLHML